MSIDTLRNALLWCALINYGVLFVWFLFFIFAHDWIHRLHGKWFRLSVEQFECSSLRWNDRIQAWHCSSQFGAVCGSADCWITSNDGRSRDERSTSLIIVFARRTRL